MRVKIMRAITDDDIEQVIHAARATVTLADRLERANETIAERDRQIEVMRAGQLASSKERSQLMVRIQAVDDLHSEAVEVACGDGCCHNGLGTCSYCKEPYPCATVRALEGTDRD